MDNKFKKCEDGSYIHNCYVERRDGDPVDALFYSDHKTMTARLNGYAIIPIDVYAKLSGKPTLISEDAIREADKHLHEKG